MYRAWIRSSHLCSSDSLREYARAVLDSSLRVECYKCRGELKDSFDKLATTIAAVETFPGEHDKIFFWNRLSFDWQTYCRLVTNRTLLDMSVVSIKKNIYTDNLSEVSIYRLI